MKNANDNTPRPVDSPEAVAQVIAQLAEARQRALNAAAIQIREWREDDRRMGIVWNDERIAK